MTSDSGGYEDPGVSRAELDALRGSVVVEFGADWCSFCQAARPYVEEAFASHPEVQHIRIADGPGRPLGRSFRVKLWPTLVALKDGAEVARAVRPESVMDVQRVLKAAIQLG